MTTLVSSSRVCTCAGTPPPTGISVTIVALAPFVCVDETAIRMVTPPNTVRTVGSAGAVAPTIAQLNVSTSRRDISDIVPPLAGQTAGHDPYSRDRTRRHQPSLVPLISARHGDHVLRCGVRVGIAADFVVYQARGEAGRAHVRVGRRRAFAFRMKNPQSPIRLEMSGRAGDLDEIARCVDSQENDVVGCAQLRRGVVRKRRCEAAQKRLVVLADQRDARFFLYAKFVVERAM